jgi:hypothetical protein
MDIEWAKDGFEQPIVCVGHARTVHENKQANTKSINFRKKKVRS